MNILSIQSHVAYGHVGNAAATFSLQRQGVEVWPIHTVQFSNHTGYGAWRGEVFGAALVRELVQGIEERGALSSCDGVLSGYMGSAEIGDAILDAVSRVKALNGKARYCCDPVIGDVGRGVFVRPGHSRIHARARGAGRRHRHPEPLRARLSFGRCEQDDRRGGARLRCLASNMGPKTVLVTSLHVEDTPKDAIDFLACGPEGRFRLRTPLLDISVNGAGDAIAALFFFHVLKSGSTADALSKAASSIFGFLKRTQEAGAREIQLVAAQEELVRPSRVFPPEALA